MSNKPDSATSGKITANGQSLYYEIHGNGPPLVLVMGIGYDATLWEPHQIPAFSAHYRVIAFDNRDAGRSSRAGEAYTVADMADDIAGLLDALEIERAHVLGISMGGMIAQEFAIRHSGRLDRLVLTGTGAATARTKFDPIATWDFVKSHDDEGMSFAAQQFVWLFSDSFLRNHEAVDQTLQMLAANEHPLDADAYHRQANAYRQHDTLDRLDQIAAPTLVVAGERDRLTPPWICREVAAGIPDARFRLVDGPGSSHVLPLERPDDFNALVLSFLGEQR
jgi:pimeloyl-ACP methyl ester carboxylesterase